MEHLPGLIADLALILITGAITTILFRRIRQPLVLGYIIAGFIIGPHFSFTPSITDHENIEIWADIGVIFLLFSLGLEFSFRKLRHIGGSASITAGVEVVFILITGYLLGILMGWKQMDSIFLGGMLASSSTTIISKAFDELKVKTEKFAGVVIGVLIVEDLVVILLMVMMSTLAVTRDFEGTSLLLTIGKLIFFLVLWFIAGIFIIPSVLRKARKLLDDETLLVLAVGLCLGMVVLATSAGFSAELGAFIMGSILAETTAAEKIEHITKPVKNLFGAVFFISVGMLIDPAIMVEYAVPILFVTLLVLFGKLFSTTAGALISGQPLRQSVSVGMSMAQVGEFAFIVASLGLSLGVTSEFLFPVAVGVSAITTFTTPYMIKYTGNFYDFLSRILPSRLLKRIEEYASGTRGLQTESSWRKVIRGYVRVILVNGLVVIAIFLAALEFLLPIAQDSIGDTLWSGIAVLVISLAAASPFLWAIMARHTEQAEENALWANKNYYRGPLLLLEIARMIIGVLITGFLLDRLFSTYVALLIGTPVIVLAIIFSRKRTNVLHERIESLFFRNLNQRENVSSADKSKSRIQVQLKSNPGLDPWDVHVIDLEVNPGASFIGVSLEDLAWREKYGINIIYIRRGNRLIFAPDKKACLHAYDHAGIISTDAQMKKFKPLFEAPPENEDEDQSIDDVIIHSLTLIPGSPLIGKTAGKSGIREATNGLVIGLERDKKRVLNPDSAIKFEEGDVVWIAGERDKIHSMLEEHAAQGNTEIADKLKV